MLEEINAAFNSEDYTTAQQLVNQLQQQDRDNPWLPLFQGRLKEIGGNLEGARGIYRQLLQNTANIKIISAARQALQNLEENAQQKHQAELLQDEAVESGVLVIESPEPEKKPAELPQAKIQLDAWELGVLVLEPLESEKKQAAALQMAKIMQIDPHTARMQLPTRTWRLYRSGSLEELRHYRNSLREAEIPCFVVATADIDKIQVYQVSYFESLLPQINLVCLTPEGEEIKLTVQWSEIGEWVQAALPIFEEITDNNKGKIEKKTSTLDYSYICDLHLFKRNLILRLGEQNYQFMQGMTFLFGQTSARNKWNSILKFLETNLPEVPLRNDFNSFAEKALDFPELLKRIPSNINLFRREESLWDAAFHLYSTLAFLRNQDD
jgi:hypothetical protein